LLKLLKSIFLEEGLVLVPEELVVYDEVSVAQLARKMLATFVTRPTAPVRLVRD
jgi:hypothetical protein